MPELTETEIKAFLTALEEAEDVTTPEFIEAHKEIAFKLIEQCIRAKIKNTPFIPKIGRLQFDEWKTDSDNLSIVDSLVDENSPLRDKLNTFLNTDLIKKAAIEKNKTVRRVLTYYSSYYPPLLIKEILQSPRQAWSSFFKKRDYDHLIFNAYYQIMEGNIKSILSWPESQEYMINNNSPYAKNINDILINIEKNFKETIRRNVTRKDLSEFALQELKDTLYFKFGIRDTDLEASLKAYVESMVTDGMMQAMCLKAAVWKVVTPEKITEFKARIKQCLSGFCNYPKSNEKYTLDSIYIEYVATYYTLCKVKAPELSHEAMHEMVRKMMNDAFYATLHAHNQAFIEMNTATHSNQQSLSLENR